MRALRRRLIAVMAHTHKISRALANYHVSQMTNAELSWRLSEYAAMELNVARSVEAPADGATRKRAS